MIGYLGNFNHVVKPWWLPFDWVLCRVTSGIGKTTVVVVSNKIAPNVVGLPVNINKRKVTCIYIPKQSQPNVCITCEKCGQYHSIYIPCPSDEDVK